jgi:oligopeptide/dipeptide ABC transporter ATP-binding protein
MLQRVMIAMAIALEPRVVIADEPTTALDVTVQSEILRLLARLQDELDTALLLITHDLGVVAGMADRVAVVYAGQVMEDTAVDELYRSPRHPYTRGLLRSVLRIDGDRAARLDSIPGQPPSAIDPPDGCPFRGRCELVRDECIRVPVLQPVPGTMHHRTACWVERGTE